MYAASSVSALASGNLHKYVATSCFALASANIHSGPQREARQLQLGPWLDFAK